MIYMMFMMCMLMDRILVFVKLCFTGFAEQYYIVYMFERLELCMFTNMIPVIVKVCLMHLESNIVVFTYI